MSDLSLPADDEGAETGSSGESLIRSVSLVVRTQQRIRSLAGFQKKFSEPDEINARTQAFVEKTASADVQSDLDSIFDRMRRAFRFKRTQLTASEFGAGGGTIECPSFSYVSYFEQDPNSAADAIWHRLITRISSPEQLLTAEFATVFDGMFDTVELVPPSEIDLELLIDRIEEVDNDEVTLDYDRNVTRCGIQIEGNDARIDVTTRALSIVHPEPASTRQLVTSLFEVQKSLVDFSGLAG